MSEFTTVALWLASDEGERWVAAQKARAWDEAAQALAWALDNGPAAEAAAYVVANNPYRVTTPTPTEPPSPTSAEACTPRHPSGPQR